MKNIKFLIIYPSQTIKDAIKKININRLRSVIVVNRQLKLLGILNDGNIRRALLTGASLSDQINSYYSTNPVYFKKNQVKKNYLKKILIQQSLNVIPIVNNKKKLINYFSLVKFVKQKTHQKKKQKIPVIIMAGGKGTRLKPFTDILPKPLIPVSGKSVLEHIIDKFLSYEMNHFVFTVQFKAELIKSYIKELKQNINMKCDFIEEKKPLGTAGSLNLLYKKINKDFFVANCDTIIKTDLNNVYDFHKKNNNVITLVVSIKEFKIPYGVCKTKVNGELNYLVEKPKSNYLVNTGFYVLKPQILKFIPKNKLFNFNQLINFAQKRKFKIGLYPIDDENWIDVGQWEEYKNALKNFETIT